MRSAPAATLPSKSNYWFSEAKAHRLVAIGFSNGFSETIDMLAEFSQKGHELWAWR